MYTSLTVSEGPPGVYIQNLRHVSMAFPGPCGAATPRILLMISCMFTAVMAQRVSLECGPVSDHDRNGASASPPWAPPLLSCAPPVAVPSVKDMCGPDSAGLRPDIVMAVGVSRMTSSSFLTLSLVRPLWEHPLSLPPHMPPHCHAGMYIYAGA